MIFQSHRVRKKIEKIIKGQSSVSLIFKCPLDYPIEMQMQEVIDFMNHQNSEYIIGLNYHKKTGEPYFKVLSTQPVDFSKWFYRVSGSRVGNRLTIADYELFFTDKEYIYIH